MISGDAFLLGYLPPLIAAHFQAVGLLEAARATATGALADRVEAQLRALPDRGAELVSAIWEIEAGFARRAAPPPAPPVTGEDCQRYLEAVWTAAPRTGTPRTAYELGQRCGTVEALAGRAARLWQLWSIGPDDPRLGARAMALRTAVREAASAATVTTDDATSASEDAAVSAELAAIATLIAAPADPASANQLGEIHARVGRCARALEAAARGTPRDAVRAWQARRLDGLALMRRLVEHQRWTVAAQLDAAGRPVPRVYTFDTNVLMAFSDRQALAERPTIVRSDRPEDALHLTVPGTLLCAWLEADNVDLLVLDPTDDQESPQTINYARKLHGALRQLAGEIAVELAAADWSRVDLAAVRNGSYWIVAHGTSPQHFVTLDGQDRPFVAMFTSEAALEAHLASGTPEAARQHAEGHRLVVPGHAILPAILALDVAGAITNPSGSGRSRTFNRRMVERLASAE